MGLSRYNAYVYKAKWSFCIRYWFTSMAGKAGYFGIGFIIQAGNGRKNFFIDLYSHWCIHHIIYQLKKMLSICHGYTEV